MKRCMGYAIVFFLCIPLLTVSQTTPWQPREGDIILYERSPNSLDNINRRFHTRMLTGRPITHSAIIVKDRNGELKLMEAVGLSGSVRPGTPNEVHLLSLDALKTEPDKLYVRKNKNPLTKNQSKNLTEFAYRQLGKKYDNKTTFNLPNTLPTKPNPYKEPEPEKYTCSQLVACAAVEAKMMNGYVHPAGVSPADLFSDNPDFDLSKRWQKPKRLIFK